MIDSSGAVVAQLSRDVDRLMHGGPEQVSRARAIPELLCIKLAVGRGSSTAEAVTRTLLQAVDLLTPAHRSTGARILLGLADNERTPFTRRVDELVRLYKAAGQSDDPDRPFRFNRQVILRAEVPDLRDDVIRKLLVLESDFSAARRSEGRRHIAARPVNTEVTWDRYNTMVAELTSQLLHLRPPADAAAESWAVIGVSRGGLPLAVHLSHQLNCRIFGVVAIWSYRSSYGDRTIVDGAFLPPRDINGNPRTVLVVDDIIASNNASSAVADLIQRRYDPDVRIVEASLLRDEHTAPVQREARWAQSFDKRTAWWWLPWEGPAPTQVGPQPADQELDADRQR